MPAKSVYLVKTSDTPFEKVSASGRLLRTSGSMLHENEEVITLTSQYQKPTGNRQQDFPLSHKEKSWE